METRITRIDTEITASVDNFDNDLTQYLEHLKLPTANVLVEKEERGRVIMNLPHVVNQISEENRLNSVYISKFVAACGVGLFDAALNFVWDETVVNLKEKVIRFDLDYFYDSVITNPERRRKLKTADDLKELDDWELVRGCHLTGIISDIGFKHMDYIRNMRNWASAAHPNQNELTGLQIVSWLETCIKEVIGKDPSGPVIEVRRLLHNIRNAILSCDDIAPIITNLSLLPHDLATSLIRTIFGMFIDPDLSTNSKNNIRLIAKSAWDNTPDEIKREIGIKYSTYGANGDISRRDSAKEFLEMVGGLAYLPLDTLAMEVGEKVNNLYQAHTSFNNFHNEPAHAKALAHYIPDNGNIPVAIRYQYVKTLLMCLIGNGYGVSNMAIPIYENLLSKFQDPEIYIFCKLIQDSEISSRLQFDNCVRRFKELLRYLKARTTNSKLIQIIDFIESRTEKQLSNVGKDSDFKSLLL
jgi:hypothetical protein